MTSTTQTIPPLDAVNVDPLNVHVPEFNDHDNEPEDWPPEAVIDNELPVVNDVALVIDNPDCCALLIVIVVFDDERSRKLVSVALVALTTHDEPAFPVVRSAPEIEHVPETTVYVTAPDPEPPVIPRTRPCPYVAVVDESEMGL